jgi:transglutaminase-like putative cysteine protease
LIYDVTHVTRYKYATTVELTNGVVRLTPVSNDEQRLERFVVTTSPPSVSHERRIDPFGNEVTSFRIETPHRELTIKASSRVLVQRIAALEMSPPWETVAVEALSVASLDSDSPALGLYPSRRVSLFGEATAYARESFPDGRPIREGAMELSRRILADFVYDPDATKVDTPAQEAFQHRHGVCQDFAHIMIAALRGLGLPALYVSGYIRTIPPPGKARLAGADASHAWVSVWCGSAVGWKDFDPTNGQAVQNDHIVVARGRDYSEASPIESLVLSSGRHTLDVEVDVIPISD